MISKIIGDGNSAASAGGKRDFTNKSMTEKVLASTQSAFKTLLIKCRGKLSLGLPLSKTEAIMAASILKYKPELLNWQTDPNIENRLAARGDYIKNALMNVQRQFDTLVLVGCGYSSFDEELAGKTVIHIDIPAVVAKKKALYSDYGISTRNNVQFIGADVNKLQFSSLNAKGRVYVILEGISYYLEPKTMDRIFSYVSAQGGKVMFDYFTEPVKNRISEFDEANRLSLELEKEGTPIKWAPDPKELSMMLSKLGLKASYNEPIEDIMQFYRLHQNPWVWFAVAEKQ